MKKIILLLLALAGTLPAFENPRLAIVISRTSFDQKWGVTQMAAHGWGAAANLAGIPYDCFFFEDLAAADLSRHQTMILAQCSYVTSAGYDGSLAALRRYLARGGHLIIDGPLAVYDDKAQPIDHAELDSLVGVRYDGFRGSEMSRIRVGDADHFITRDFAPEQYLTQHLTGGLNILGGGRALLVSGDEKASYPFLSVQNREKSRIVLVSDFSTWAGAASFFRNVQPQVFYRNELFNVMIRAIHWTLYGEPASPFPVPQISNANLTAIVRLDADGSGNLSEQITTINYLTEIARESGVVPVYAWVSSQATKAGWQDLAPYGKKLEEVGGEIGTHSRFHRIDEAMTEERWRDELDGSIHEIEFNTADYGYSIGKVECMINPGNTIRMSDYEQVASRISFYMTHGFEQDMPLGFGNFTWYTGKHKNLALLEDTPSPDYQWFYDPTWSYTTQQITAYQEAIFDHLFERIGRGVVYNQMWHDYSITSQPQYGKSRIVNSSNIAMYDAIRRKFASKEIYAPAPIELGHKLRLMAQWDYSWRAEKDKLFLTLDLTRVNLDTMPSFSGGMGIAIDNCDQFIQEVLLDGRIHDAFSDRLIILPNLSRGKHSFEIRLGDRPALQPHLAYISQIMPSCRRSGDELIVEVRTRNRARFRFEAATDLLLLNADAQSRDRLQGTRLSGHATSDRQIVLAHLPAPLQEVTRATMAIAAARKMKKSVLFDLKANALEENQLWLRAGDRPKQVLLSGKPVPWSVVEGEIRIALGPAKGDTQLSIEF
ncbi:MAG TPA: hypothetical protein PLN72_01335 [bacterium]|nr:hypothetical protein [bacterium]HPM58195.1 hypothetical protein [bacterium]